MGTMAGETNRLKGGSKRRWASLVGVLLSLSVWAGVAEAARHEARVPLKEGKASLSDLSAALCEGLGVKPVRVPGGTLNLTGVKRLHFVAAMNESLGDGCRLTFAPDALVLSIDTDKLPKDCDAASRAVRIFTAVEYPEATTAQRKNQGLRLPDQIDDAKPLVVLVHGLDSSRMMWDGLCEMLAQSGRQVAFFSYPSDGPIRDSADFLCKELTAFHQRHPAVRIDLICHSMGGLVARAMVEGPGYCGGVDRLILVGTPNAGSSWSKYRLALEVQEHYRLWKSDRNWSPTWMITDGLGEAGRDLAPGSAFLNALNAQPRREGVKYTIVAGCQSPITSTCADWWECSARTLIPDCVGGCWGFRHARSYMNGKASVLRSAPEDSDGPVLVKSTRLTGVTDWVVVQATHGGLVWGDSPAAWPIILDRLGRE